MKNSEFRPNLHNINHSTYKRENWHNYDVPNKQACNVNSAVTKHIATALTDTWCSLVSYFILTFYAAHVFLEHIITGLKNVTWSLLLILLYFIISKSKAKIDSRRKYNWNMRISVSSQTRTSWSIDMKFWKIDFIVEIMLKAVVRERHVK